MFLWEKSSPEHEISKDQIYFFVISVIIVHGKAGFLLKVIAVIGQDPPVDSLCPNIGNGLWIPLDYGLASLYSLFDMGLNSVNPLLHMGLRVWVILCILELLVSLFSMFSYFTVLTENWYKYTFLYCPCTTVPHQNGQNITFSSTLFLS